MSGEFVRWKIIREDRCLSYFARHQDLWYIALLLVERGDVGWEGVTRLVDSIPARKLTAVSVSNFLNEAIQLGYLNRSEGKKKNSYRIAMSESSRKCFELLLDHIPPSATAPAST